MGHSLNEGGMMKSGASGTGVHYLAETSSRLRHGAAGEKVNGLSHIHDFYGRVALGDAGVKPPPPCAFAGNREKH